MCVHEISCYFPIGFIVQRSSPSKMSGDLGLGGDKRLEGCSEEVRRQLHHSRALPGCLIGVIVFQGRLKKWSAECEHITSFVLT